MLVVCMIRFLELALDLLHTALLAGEVQGAPNAYGTYFDLLGKQPANR